MRKEGCLADLAREIAGCRPAVAGREGKLLTRD